MDGDEVFLGAYWAQREESREQAAARVTSFLHKCGQTSGLLERWYKKGRSRAGSREPVPINEAALAKEFSVQRRFDNKQVMAELGFSMGIWNGVAASFSATIGVFSPAVHNSAVLSFSESPGFAGEEWRKLVSAAIAAFDPDAAAVTSVEHMDEVGAEDPYEAGWFLYRRGGEITEHPFS